MPNQRKGYEISAYAPLEVYSDASEVSVYAKPALQWMVGTQNIQGSGGNLLPTGSATRAQTAAVLMRFLVNLSIGEPAETAAPGQTTEPKQPTSTAPAQSEED